MNEYKMNWEKNLIGVSLNKLLRSCKQYKQPQQRLFATVCSIREYIEGVIGKAIKIKPNLAAKAQYKYACASKRPGILYKRSSSKEVREE
jgi:hypothetical protein